VRTIRNTQIHCVGRMQSSGVLMKGCNIVVTVSEWFQGWGCKSKQSPRSVTVGQSLIHEVLLTLRFQFMFCFMPSLGASESPRLFQHLLCETRGTGCPRSKRPHLTPHRAGPEFLSKKHRLSGMTGLAVFLSLSRPVLSRPDSYHLPFIVTFQYHSTL
jgi:hypothetical protein